VAGEPAARRCRSPIYFDVSYVLEYNQAPTVKSSDITHLDNGPHAFF
jgi:hypothetical protein